MSLIQKIGVCTGVFWIAVPEAHLYLLCGCPADAVKHLRKKGLIVSREEKGVVFETGPNAILLSDISIQNGHFANLSEFPVLQMLYLQGMIVPNHPGNTGEKPLLIGAYEQIASQMQYIYRGNYGLISEEEIRAAGVAPQAAKEMMRLKLRFAFGNIRRTEELLDACTVDTAFSEIRDGVSIRRVHTNVFELRYREESVTVDLNLAPGEFYPPPYPLGFHRIHRDYFSVIHSGEGDGWDENRPCMASVLSFQGKIYLIDAGPNILFILEALGIAVNEVEGIFMSHAHDDHFAGLTALMRADHRIRFLAHPLVRLSVAKKLCALTSMTEDQFGDYFDVVDLRLDRWNDIHSLEVKPIFSPHPVETTVFFFRALSEDGYRVYAHFADIAGLDVLENMVTGDASSPGITEDFYRQVGKKYRQRAHLKKLDIGGGMIHGMAADFASDRSERIILAHTSRELTRQEKLIGSGTSFGMVDTLISTHQDYVRKISYTILSSYLPDLTKDKVDLLLNHPIESYNPRTILLKSGESSRYVHFILTGDVERIRPHSETTSTLSVGGCFGESFGPAKTESTDTYRAINFVQALKIPFSIFAHVTQEHRLCEEMEQLWEKRAFLQDTWLLGEELSAKLQIEIARAMTAETLPARQQVPRENRTGLYVIREGAAVLCLEDEPLQELGRGDFIGSHKLLFGIPTLFRLHSEESLSLYHIPIHCLADIPIIRWKLYESYLKRMRRMMERQMAEGTLFLWRGAYDTGISDMDEEHRKLFEIARNLYLEVRSPTGGTRVEDWFQQLQTRMESHFQAEERLMEAHGYTGADSHRTMHRDYLREVVRKEKRQTDASLSLEEIMVFFRNWMIHHVLTEDRKLGMFLRRKTTT